MRLGGGACRFVGMCYCKTEPSSGAWERVQCWMKLIRVILFFIFYFFFQNCAIYQSVHSVLARRWIEILDSRFFGAVGLTVITCF